MATSTSLETDRLLTVREVAELLKVPTSWVYGHTRRRTPDRLPHLRLGKYLRFRESDLLDWLNHQGEKAG